MLCRWSGLPAAARRIGRAASVRVVHRLADASALGLGELVEDVAHLVHLAPLDERERAEDVAHGLRERLAAVDHHQQRAVGSKATLAQIRQQRRA